MYKNSARYLITGGAGFIGSHIAEALLSQGESVRIFDNFSTGKRQTIELLERLPGHLEVQHGDIRNSEALEAAVAGVEVVWHQAAIASVPFSITEPKLTLDVNVNGTQNVLLAARDAGVRRVVFASSSAIYGNSPLLPKHEELSPEPLSPYALHKLSSEQLCRIFTQLYKLETVALRYFNVFGPRQDPKSEYAAVIPRFLTAILQGEQPVIFGDGEQTRDFIFIDNIVQANLLASTSESAVGKTMNIGSGTRTSLNEVLRCAGELLNTPVKAIYTHVRPGDVRESVADITRSEQLLGFHPTISFRQGLARTLESIKIQRKQ
ncbi:SDR family oxidoreductase [Tengunoibacter tsumagoiensis]|uniref:GDP-mannose 4,6-dehydratase n=1 Tax=Tengunoibacter tsumagoiensis TaxID=2014871 RepID=A0A401ZY30_9CHLR|nr:SDR family oxidoreductase [Tengunoibacter tsumagoiensis]GCE11733.1 GDP-mannose 4,6-dehydratase [Tengunoibacter tsumagoiensis]